ncbi:DUF1254 domain-containing protein [Streptomyces sp. NBC_01800]|uniref:DUF1254 domain-containing protein n=1 Tax=Streptomyces sp. NBC_01800 TaxID=2975945 RepID=UPI003FA3913E
MARRSSRCPTSATGWVIQLVNQRTDSFGQLGAMNNTEPGHYLVAPTSWDGAVPDGIRAVLRYDTGVV